MVKFLRPTVEAVVLGYLISKTSAAPTRSRAKRGFSFFESAFGHKFDWLAGSSIDDSLEDDSYDDYSIGTTEMMTEMIVEAAPQIQIKSALGGNDDDEHFHEHSQKKPNLPPGYETWMDSLNDEIDDGEAGEGAATMDELLATTTVPYSTTEYSTEYFTTLEAAPRGAKIEVPEEEEAETTTMTTTAMDYNEEDYASTTMTTTADFDVTTMFDPFATEASLEEEAEEEVEEADDVAIDPLEDFDPFRGVGDDDEEEEGDEEAGSDFDKAKLASYAAGLKAKRENESDAEKSLLMKLNAIKKIKKKKEQLQNQKAMQDNSQAEKAEKKAAKDDRVEDREQAASDKADRQEAAQDKKENRESNIAANKLAREDALSEKREKIAEAKEARLQERLEKQSAKEAKQSERDDNSDAMAAKKAAAVERKRVNKERREENEDKRAEREKTTNDQDLPKRKFKTKCGSVKDSDQFNFSDSLKSKFPADGEMNKHCLDGVAGDTCYFKWTESNVCGNTKPMFRRKAAENEDQESFSWTKMAKLECVEATDGEGIKTGHWKPTNDDFSEETSKIPLEFGCGGCSWPSNESFDKDVVEIGEGVGKTTTRITAGRGAEFVCFDENDVQVWGDTVPVNGYCKVNCVTTQVAAINVKITCEADSVDDDTKQIYSKLSVVNGQVNKWKGIDKLDKFLNLDKYQNDALMAAKWASQESGESKIGWLCYHHIQPTYEEAWITEGVDKAWSACNARGWKSRSRTCEGTCDDAFQYKKCDFDE